MDGHGCRNTTNSNVRATPASDNMNPGHPHSPHRNRQGYLAARDFIPRPAAPGPVDLESQAINSLSEEPFFSSDEYADFSSTSTSSQSSPGTSFEHPNWEYADWARIIPARYVHYEEPEKPDQQGCWQWGLIVLFVVALGSIGGVIVAVHH